MTPSATNSSLVEHGEPKVRKWPKKGTYEDAAKLIAYDPITGEFTWRVSPRNGVNPGDRAGSMTARGYAFVRHRGGWLFAHRLAFVIMTGKRPAGVVDHIDGNPGNNAWANLRECSDAQNAQNSKVPKNNTSGYPGVVFRKKSGTWAAAIRTEGRRIHLGTFRDKLEAYAAYLTAKAKYHTFAPRGCNLPLTEEST